MRNQAPDITGILVRGITPEKKKQAEAKHRYYVAHKEERTEYQRRYCEAHKEEQAEYQRRYRVAHKKRRAECQHRYYVANKLKCAGGQIVTRASERRDCPSYQDCLTATAIKNMWVVPCLGCEKGAAGV